MYLQNVSHAVHPMDSLLNTSVLVTLEDDLKHLVFSSGPLSLNRFSSFPTFTSQDAPEILRFLGRQPRTNRADLRQNYIDKYFLKSVQLLQIL